MQIDLGSFASVRAAAAEVITKLEGGKIDVLLNNAGISTSVSIIFLPIS